MNGRARLRDNLAANLVGTSVAAAAAVLSAPLIYRWLGSGAYGLVGVYVLLQTLMPLVDAGITAGLARAVSWHRGTSLGQVRTLVRMAEKAVAAIALLFLLIALLSADSISQSWIADSALPTSTTRTVLSYMAAALSVRLVAGLGRATLMALELQASANAVQAMAAVARTFGAVLFAVVTDTGILGFFAAQVPISIIEWWAYRARVREALGQPEAPVSREDLQRHLKFAIGIAGLSAAWLLTSQIDKALLAERLSLPGYGAYSLGVHIASGLLLAVGSVHGAMLPRLTHYFAMGEEARVLTLYGISTALTVAMCCAVLVAIAVGARSVVPSLRIPVDGVEPMQMAWLYGIGNAGAAVLALGYQLQNARGVLRLHAFGTVLQAIVQVPLMVWGAWKGDAVRTAIVFAVVNGAFAVVWLPVVHGRFLPGGHARWLMRHLLPALLAAVAVGAVSIQAANFMPAGVVWGAVTVILAAGATFSAAMLADADVREVVRSWRTVHAR